MAEPVLDAFTRAYLIAALFTDDPMPRSGEFAEHDDWTIANIYPDHVARAIEVCAQFQADNRADLDAVTDTYHADAAQHGHDLWLTRNGHGAGFWDRGYDLDNLGDRLSDACRAYGECWVSGPDTEDNGASTPEQIAAWNKIIYIEGQ